MYINKKACITFAVVGGGATFRVGGTFKIGGTFRVVFFLGEHGCITITINHKTQQTNKSNHIIGIIITKSF